MRFPAVFLSSSYPAVWFTFNPLRAKCAIRNIKFHLQFVKSPHTYMTQVT